VYNQIIMRMLAGNAAAIALWAVVATGGRGQQVVLPPNMGVPDAAPTVPGPGYDLALSALAAGDYAAGLEIAEREYRGSAKIGPDRWIDSIASAAVLGECLYETGQWREALGRYEEALALSAAHPNWLLSVRFPPQPLAALRGRTVATWGRSKRNTTPAMIPDTMTIRQQGADPQQVLQQGGKLTAPYERPIRPQEVMRSLVIATYRTGSLLGELASENNPLDRAFRNLSRRPAPQAHYSQSWIDIALGTAAWARGRPREAEPLLIRGLMVGNQFDHPLTTWGLIVLGRIAIDAGNPAKAVELFEEASYVAAAYADARGLEEAFRWIAVAHRLQGGPGVAPSIARAVEATRRGPAALRARLLAMQAVAAASAGDARGARETLAAIDGRLLGGDAGQGTLGAMARYAEALTAYVAGDVAAGDESLGQALVLARRRSPSLFRTGLLVELVRAGSSTPGARQAEDWLSAWLADPTPQQFAADPLEMLAVITATRQPAFDTWVAVAAQRRRHEVLMDAAEATMRQRWIAARSLGGRREAIERFLLNSPQLLGDAAAARQRNLINGRPGLSDLLVKLRQLQGDLAATVAAAPDGELPGGDPAWRDYAAASARLRQTTALFAAGGQADAPLFPPLTKTEEICRRLEPGQALLSFHWTESGLFAALESRDRQKTWQVKQAAGLPRELTALAQELSLRERATVVGTDRLVAGDWQGSAVRLERMLFENSDGVRLSDGIDELIVVPDGWLWYLPFEILPIASNQAGDRTPLRDVCRLRYAPTRSLAVRSFEPRAGGDTGLLLGQFFRGQKREAATAAAREVAAGLERSTTLEVPASGPAARLVGSLFDTLVILDELPAAAADGSRPLLVAGGGRGGMAFADWLAPPPKRPWQMIVPGLQTAMAGGLATPPQRPGEEVFLATTDLLAAGATTAIVSRWRSLGKTSEGLLREYLRETAGPGGLRPAEAWQRAVDLVTAERPDVLREPRLKPAGDAVLADSRHPLLWAGLLLVDCGGGVYEAAGPPRPRPPPPLAPAVPPRPLRPAAGGQQPEARPPAPMPPAILPPPPPREVEPVGDQDDAAGGDAGGDPAAAGP